MAIKKCYLTFVMEVLVVRAEVLYGFVQHEHAHGCLQSMLGFLLLQSRLNSQAEHTPHSAAGSAYCCTNGPSQCPWKYTLALTSPCEVYQHRKVLKTEELVYAFWFLTTVTTAFLAIVREERKKSDQPRA